jgi:Mg-chelatase subunit ChlD
MHKKLLLYSFILSGICLFESNYAQNPNMKLSTETIDFGRIAAVKYPPKTIEFTNTSKEKLAILVIEKSPNVKVGYQHLFFEPGEQGTITLFYDAAKLGSFSEQIKIFTNLDNEPYLVTLKGTCISREECFPDKANMNKRNILVINKETQKPVTFAQVSFVHNFKTESPIVCKMDKNGTALKDLPIGQYTAQSNTDGFEPYTLDFFLPRSEPNVLIELVPKKTLASKSTEIVPPITPETPVKPEISPGTEIKPVVVTSTELPEDKYAANNIVLLLDVSSSMRDNNKFSLLQQSVNNLVMILRPIDYVSIITYSSDAQVILESIPGNEKDKIMEVVQELNASGTTQGVKGLNTAYSLATSKFLQNGNNQVILATDGQFSEKNVSDEYYADLISGYAEKGIKLSILGFGVNVDAITRMKKMTSAGRGSYIQIKPQDLTKNILINEIKAMSFLGNR